MTHRKSNRTLNRLVNEFLEELKRTTGVSALFLESAKPAVVRLFRDVPPNRIEQAKVHFYETAKKQAETEQHLANALEHLDALNNQDEHQPTQNIHTAKQIALTKGLVVNTLLRTYGGFGDRVSIDS